MSFSARQLRGFCWLALLAVLALGVMPTVSHAIVSSSGKSSWVEVCTPQGMRWVAFSAGVDSSAGDDAPTQAGAQLEHCPYCSQPGGNLGMPPAPMQPLPLQWFGAGVPSLFLEAPRTLPVWCSAQPRAPPAVS